VNGTMSRLFLALVVGLTGLTAAAGQEKKPAEKRVTFRVSAVPFDPFTGRNVVGAADSTPPEVRRGEVFYLTIDGTLAKGYHTYPLTRRTEKQSQNDQLVFDKSVPFTPLYPLAYETPPEFKWDSEFGILLEHEKPFTWVQPVRLSPDAPVGKTVDLKLTIRALVCDEKACTPEKLEYTVPVRVADGPVVPELPQGLTEKVPEIEVVPVPPEVRKRLEPAVVARSTTATPVQSTANRSLLALLLTTAGAAVAMLLTPCVFPMIPITVSFFLKQHEKEHRDPVLLAGVYALTIIVVLSLAVLLLGQLVVSLANSVWVNLGLGLVLGFFALSLFGMYEIELPSFLGRFTSAREGQGYVGALFMALTFTITSFTCTGPFLGPLLVATKELQLDTTRLILASLVYSTVFAAPFFVLALFPQLLKSLPKSGGWLNVVKVVMGFLELGAALSFLGNADATFNPGNPVLFTYDSVLAAWIALSVACGLYLLGVYRLPHDTPVQSLSVSRMLLAALFLSFALYITPALGRRQPVGVVGGWVVAYLPRDTAEPGTAGGSVADHLTWHLDYEEAWKEAVREKKLLFIDFTGVNCKNCRDNENRVFPQAKVRAELAKFVRVQIYNDSVPKRGLTAAQAQAEADRNRDLQNATYHDVSTPLYVILDPARDKPIADGKIKGTELGRFAGTIANGQIDDFVQMMENAGRKQLASNP
jgi:thiol:disulfide interchange protein